MTDDEYVEPWSWIPHVEGADRQKEINAYLNKMLDVIALAPGMRWNPNTSKMEPHNHLDDLGGSFAASQPSSTQEKT